MLLIITTQPFFKNQRPTNPLPKKEIQVPYVI